MAAVTDIGPLIIRLIKTRASTVNKRTFFFSLRRASISSSSAHSRAVNSAFAFPDGSPPPPRPSVSLAASLTSPPEECLQYAHANTTVIFHCTQNYRQNGGKQPTFILCGT